MTVLADAVRAGGRVPFHPVQAEREGPVRRYVRSLWKDDIIAEDSVLAGAVRAG